MIKHMLLVDRDGNQGVIPRNSATNQPNNGQDDKCQLAKNTTVQRQEIDRKMQRVALKLNLSGKLGQGANCQLKELKAAQPEHNSQRVDNPTGTVYCFALEANCYQAASTSPDYISEVSPLAQDLKFLRHKSQVRSHEVRHCHYIRLDPDRRNLR
ncbi:uncharacterized protein PITG_14999 [Phytophthora infestans T30-4]|uniref:Uncharacterized protein n=1 Tax=Phytophthora infestans (strain T30-4) TaxID=403677 RepID=D0NPI4_PHYIT|nr:uncharacterized protein PITG_14999 [Phytophthora infestans T30-4]EEY62526.1 hypothetical protein PITG_14999 [Phytophthora infestans T30-4]|eukprot:XP_002899162.1 hypothetical protein PITG_14999 [Phytophthora infestans T30-4]